MISLKLVTSSIRGGTALVSNQMSVTVSGVVVNSLYESKTSYAIHSDHLQSSSNIFTRQLSIGVRLQQATRSAKLIKPSSINRQDIEAELPPKPKKPITPWILFVRERKDEILSQKAKMTAAELSVILAKEWKQIDKSKYEQEYKQKRDEYLKVVEDYHNSLTDHQRDLIDVQKSLKRETRTTKMIRKTNPPVLPRNPANLYCHERSKQDDFKEMLKYRKPAQVFSDIFKEYREMSDEAKRKYLDMQEDDKARFQHEFLLWYEGIQTNENLTKAAREQANVMRDRLRALNYI